MSIPEIEQAKANSPSILFISTFSQFRNFAVFNFSFSTGSKKKLYELSRNFAIPQLNRPKQDRLPLMIYEHSRK
ncbi:MAG: hypothetical protein IPL23_27475 [Saprospiraceae bacterium]|nr:hypothetical protein [Saprospiraceae bacterium]